MTARELDDTSADFKNISSLIYTALSDFLTEEQEA